MKILRRDRYEHQQMASRKTGENYSLSAVLSGSIGSQDIFLHHEILNPGKRSSASHFHRATDEIIYVLKGTVTLHEGEERETANAGDCVCFKAGSGALHFVSNETSQDVELLVMTKNLNSPDVVFE